MREKTLDQILSLISDVANTVNILKLGQRINEARSDQERLYLAEALTRLLRTDNLNCIRGPHNGYDDNPMY